MPDESNLMLISRADVERQSTVQASADAMSKLAPDWGWLAAVAVSEDCTVMNISRVSGEQGPSRVVVVHSMLEWSAELPPLQIARNVIAECASGHYENMTVAVCSGGVGVAVYSALKHLVQQDWAPKVNLIWLHDLGASLDKSSGGGRFRNLRGKAYIYGRDALLSGRMAIDSGPATIDQFSKLPLMLDESGLWVMNKREGMRSGRADSYMLAQIFDVVPRQDEPDQLDVMADFSAGRDYSVSSIWRASDHEGAKVIHEA